MFANVSIWQLLIVLLIVAVLFGTKKLKGLGEDLGGAIKGFKNAIKDDEKEENLSKAEMKTETQKDNKENV